MHESLRLYQLCVVTEWVQLPIMGGLYEQDPDWLEHILIIKSTVSKVEKDNQEKEQRKSKSKGKKK